jgi:hypothetical protein
MMAESYDRGSPMQAVKSWFAEQGVPHFLPRYSPTERAPVLVLSLLMVLAVQLGAGTWFDVTVIQLLVIPPIMVALALVFRLFDGPLGLGQTRPQQWWLLPLSLLVLVTVPYVGAAIVGQPAYEQPPWSRPDPWIDTAVLFTALLASTLLFRGNLWDSRAGRCWRLFVFVIAAAVLFELEGSVLPPLGSQPSEQGIFPVPHSLPALIVVATILAMSLRLARGSVEQSTSSAISARNVASFVPVAPLLVLTLGVDNAVLASSMGGWAEAVTPLVLLLAFAAVFAAVQRWRPQQPPWQIGSVTRLAHLTSWPTLLFWILAFLFLYPVMAWFFNIQVSGFGPPATGWRALLIILGINILGLGVTWFIIWFGLDRIAGWALREGPRNLSDILVAFAHGLPLLLIFTAFFALTAETWEIVVEAGPVAFLGLLGLLLGLMAFFLLISSIHELRGHRRFATWADVRTCAVGGEHQSKLSPADPISQVVEKAVRGKDLAREPRNVEVGILGWLNAMLVMAIYQVLIFTPVAVGAFAFFLLLARLAVPPEVAAEWVFGDGADPALGLMLDKRPFVEEPWTRVAVVLAVFSVLYLTVTVLTDENHRKTFFGVADDAIRQRFAMRLAYDEAHKLDKKGEGGRLPDDQFTASGSQHAAATGNYRVGPARPRSPAGP